MSSILIPDELILIAGRQFRYCDFDKAAKKDAEGMYVRPLLVKSKEECNLWSSQSRMDPTKHLPCFDVDVRPETELLPGLLKERHHTVEGYISFMFPEKEAQWVPSTTEGHFHVYIDHPYLWDDYQNRLRSLSTVYVAPWQTKNNQTIVEENYVWYSKEHGASHVRMPHVKKVFTQRQTN